MSDMKREEKSIERIILGKDEPMEQSVKLIIDRTEDGIGIRIETTGTASFTLTAAADILAFLQEQTGGDPEVMHGSAIYTSIKEMAGDVLSAKAAAEKESTNFSNNKN